VIGLASSNVRYDTTALWAVSSITLDSPAGTGGYGASGSTGVLSSPGSASDFGPFVGGAAGDPGLDDGAARGGGGGGGGAAGPFGDGGAGGQGGGGNLTMSLQGASAAANTGAGGGGSGTTGKGGSSGGTNVGGDGGSGRVIIVQVLESP
jgi:hypothetical protein